MEGGFAVGLRSIRRVGQNAYQGGLMDAAPSGGEGSGNGDAISSRY